MTKHQIIDETVEFYRTHPKSINPHTLTCSYRGLNGAKCAVARCCYDDSIFTEGRCASDQHRCQGQLKFMPAYQGHGMMFWDDLQALHDNDTHWMPDGSLSQQGDSCVAALKFKYE